MNVNLDAKYELYINGQWVAPSGGKYFTTTNPATGEKLAECAEATKEDVDAAVQAGLKESWELAEHFHVTEDFFKKAVCYYCNGNLETQWYYGK